MTVLRPQMTNGLHWVRAELDQSLARTRGMIEQHLENPKDALPLQQAFVELHQVRGTAAMIQCFGVATFSEEMRQAVHELMHDKLKQTESAYSALLSAVVQLDDYIDALASGMDDCVLVLHPAINELRVARARPLLTEADLFAAQMQSLALNPPVPETPGRSEASAQMLARKLLPLFQSSLLQWLSKQAEAKTGLARIGKIAEQLAQASATTGGYQLWRVLAALVEAMLSLSLEESGEIKRLLGAAGKQIKALADEGENGAALKQNDLSYQLLFHVGRSGAQGARVMSLRSDYQLDNNLPPAAQVEELRKRIHGPTASLLIKVADEIRNDLAQIKDSIDLMVRTGGKVGPEMDETRTRIKRVADTLSALGLQMLQRVISNQLVLLENANEVRPGAPDLWMEMATAILRVEHSLDAALFRQLRREPLDKAAGRPELEEQVPHSRDLHEGAQALLRESLVSLSRLKSVVDGYIKTGESTHLLEAAKMLNEISAGLLIMEDDRASMLTAQFERYVRSPMFAQLRESPERADRFADAIACVEYYLEAVREENPLAEKMLENLAGFAELLDFTEPVQPLVSGQAVVEDAMFLPEAEVAGARVEQPAVSLEAVDPEIRDIFVEEAGEVLGQLQSVLPRWVHHPDDTEILTTIRRGFHTLKGSGRMVGAASIGDFGWAIENLVNRCLDSTISLNVDIVNTVQQAVELLPGLIDDFRDGRQPGSVIAALIERAGNLASGRAAGAAMEPDIVQVFRDDAREKLGAITGWLGEQDRESGRFSINEETLRAFHTLRGSAAVIGAHALSDLTGGLETYLDSARSAGLSLPPQALDLLDDICVELLHWIESAGTPAMQSHDARPWLQRIEELQAQLPASAVRATADRQLAVVFADEALELLQKIEHTVNEWSRAPDSRQAARDLKNDCHTLMGAALMSDCPAIAGIARALHDRMQEAIATSPLPDAGFFGRLAMILEQVYQLLDRYREGDATHTGEREAASIRDLPWTGAGAAATVPESSVVTAPVQHADFAEPVIEMPEVAEAADESQVLEMPPVEMPSVDMPPPAADDAVAEDYVARGDEELRALFLSEGHELLENIDAYSSAWERNPYSPEPAEQLKQLVHTLKGSALMAGLSDLGQVAHRLKMLIADVTRDGQVPGTAFFDRLHHVSDGLHRVLNDMQGNAVPDVAGLLAELEAPLAADPIAPPFEEELPLVPAPAEPLSAAAPAAAPMVEVEAAALDPELVEIFTAEAGELLEGLEKALTAWESNPHNIQALRDMQHVLHTLKGGARMAGLEVMGNVAHDMETRANLIEQSPQSADADAFAVLTADLESLQAMHDRLQRGESAALAQTAIPVLPQMSAAPMAAVAVNAPSSSAETAPVQSIPVEPVPAPVVQAKQRVVPAGWDAELFWRPEEDVSLSAMRRETARVPVETLDDMLNQAGEISIYRSRLEQHNTNLQSQLTEMNQAVTRLREQLRMMDIETEAQISARGMISGKEVDRYEGNFDPLEMDRYTRMQELSRALSESVGDLANLRGSMEEMVSEAETLLLQQGRINTEVQTGLMGTLMVPFSRQVARLQRVVKQTAQEIGKQAEAVFSGIESELDRNVLERMTAPLEHLLRNSVVHGIEDPAVRARAGKAEMGQVQVNLWREGTQLLIELRDDGKGLDIKAIRETAIKRGLMPPDAEIPDDTVAQFIFEPGFSTAKQLTQAAGRGIGMDVVAAEVKQLGGTLELGSEAGKGARFLIRLPLTLSISQALLVGVGSEQFAIPLPSIEGIARIPKDRLDELYAEDGPDFTYGAHSYRVRYLGDFIGVERERLETAQKTVNAILVRLGEGLSAQERHVAVVVDALYGNREVVSKAVGPQVSSVSGVSGATILADGSVVLILDVPALAQDRTRRVLLTGAEASAMAPAPVEETDLIMVVDDSITIRRVTERLLLKNGFRVVTAKDGLDAMAQLQTIQPATVLLDIEMPRADGFEVATFIRNSETLRATPIIMITSRSGDKHRERARQIGVNRYMIKPFQEEQLVAEVRDLIQETAA